MKKVVFMPQGFICETCDSFMEAMYQGKRKVVLRCINDKCAAHHIVMQTQLPVLVMESALLIRPTLAAKDDPVLIPSEEKRS